MWDEPEPPYDGPFVVLSFADPIGFTVAIDPPPPGLDPTRTFSDKQAAWAYASQWWTALRCPLRDLTHKNVARAVHDSSEKSCSN